MKPALLLLLAALLGGFRAPATEHAPAQDSTPPAPTPLATPDCVQVTTEARYGAYGYDHLVQIRNGCKQAAACTVSTNAAPTPVSVNVAAGSTSTVTTFRGSPAREFTASVNCTLEGP